MQIVERFYRSAYGTHRFLRNVVGIDAVVYRLKENITVLPQTPPNPLSQWFSMDQEDKDNLRRVYGPAASATINQVPSFSVRLMMPLYTMSKFTEEASELGDVTCYTFDEKLEIGDSIRTTIGDRDIFFHIIKKETIGYSKNIVYRLTMSCKAISGTRQIETHR
jgi:hypothetical protein